MMWIISTMFLIVRSCADWLDCRVAKLLNSGVMRTLIAIILIAVMSLQAAAAAIGSYCQHEQDAVAKHVGHHEHQHKKAHPENATGADSDCGMCQAGVIFGFPSELTLVTLSLLHADPIATMAGQAPPPPLDRPERPNWPKSA
jgi:hypothetical protein